LHFFALHSPNRHNGSAWRATPREAREAVAKCVTPGRKTLVPYATEDRGTSECPASLISKSAFNWALNMWVIESLFNRLRKWRYRRWIRCSARQSRRQRP